MLKLLVLEVGSEKKPWSMISGLEAAKKKVRVIETEFDN
jgi:hypothetical protein